MKLSIDSCILESDNRVEVQLTPEKHGALAALNLMQVDIHV